MAVKHREIYDYSDYELKELVQELESEIGRHHEDFIKIRKAVEGIEDALDNEDDMWDELKILHYVKDIRNVVG